MTTTTKGPTMTTPESPATPVFAPHSPAAGAQVPTEPGNGTGPHTLAAYVVRVTTDNVRMDRVRCDECKHYGGRRFTEYEHGGWDGYGFCMLAERWDHISDAKRGLVMFATHKVLMRADHACNAWTPKAGQ